MIIKTFELPESIAADFDCVLDNSLDKTKFLQFSMYNTVVCDKDSLSDAIKQYFCLGELFKVTVETVRKPVLPMHTDVYNATGGYTRQSHVVVNPQSKPILIKTASEDFQLESNHWFLLNSTLLHGAECTPPHSVVCIDAFLNYDEYAALLGVS